MRQTRKGNQFVFGMETHIGVDAEPGLVLSLAGKVAKLAGVTQVDQLPHGEETYVIGDSAFTRVQRIRIMDTAAGASSHVLIM